MSPSCSRILSEYRTLCWGQFNNSDNLIIPIGSCVMIALSIVTCLWSKSISLSILLVRMLLPRIFFSKRRDNMC